MPPAITAVWPGTGDHDFLTDSLQLGDRLWYLELWAVLTDVLGPGQVRPGKRGRLGPP